MVTKGSQRQYGTCRKKLREVLMQNGFGVITEINIKEKLEEKLG